MKLTDNYIRGKLLSVGVPDALIEEALASFNRAKKINRATHKFTLIAAESSALLVPFVKWKAEALPKAFKILDNNVSINGDRTDWIIIDGQIQYDKAPLDPKQIRNSNGDKPNYYMNLFKNWHVRSIPARMIWLGFRNRASWVNAQLGVYAKFDSWENGKPVFKDTWSNQDENDIGIKVIRHNGEWQLIETKSFMKKFTKRIVIGYKFDNVNEINRLASVVYTVGAIRS